MAADRKPVIKIHQLNKTFFIREKQIRTIRDSILHFKRFKANHHKIVALEDINFEVMEGDIYGIIGSNGSGKSTLLNIILGSMRPDKGSMIQTKGKIIRLALGMGFDPELSARHNIYVNGSILGLPFRKIGNLFAEIIDFADLHDFVDTPIKFYSSGMQMRLAFSIAMHANADIFLLDEVFGGVGDENFRNKSSKIFRNTIIEKRTVLLVSHNLEHILKYCNKALLINRGKQIMIGDPKEVVEKYKSIVEKH